MVLIVAPSSTGVSMPQTSAIPAGSSALHVAFWGITVLVVLLFVAAVYWASLKLGGTRESAIRQATIGAIAAVAWVGLTFLVASRELLSFDRRPPTMIFLLLAVLALALWISLSSLGRRLALGIPLAALVGYQGFRILVELSMHRAHVEGLMQVQMSYSGRNFDIMTGLSAVVVGAWLATGERRTWRPVVLVWNTIGVLLLLNILVVALLSAPTPARVFMNEPANVWITGAPWAWLPAVMVLAAIIGHLLVYRRLRLT